MVLEQPLGPAPPRPRLAWSARLELASLDRRSAFAADVPSSPFFFDNAGPLGLYPPSFGTRWVRNGSDLLLVVVRTGEIWDVAWGVFF